MTFKEWLDRICKLKVELERLGCKVDITVQVEDGYAAVGQEQEAGGRRGSHEL